MKKFKIKSYCKINLFLRVINKLNNGYHNIVTLITFCNLHDVITISKTKDVNDKINFYGRFSRGIDNKKNSVTMLLNLLRKNLLLKNQKFKIDIKKNIPHGSGLGGGSSNAAYILKYLNLKMRLKLKKNKIKKIARKVGFDVPISLERKNTFLIGRKDQMIRLNKKFKLNILIVYPNLTCSTKEIYKKNKTRSSLKQKSFFSMKNKQLINFIKNERNDLEKTVNKIYPRVKKIIQHIKSQKGCYFSRITGSGSACIGIFSNLKNAISAQKKIKFKYPNYWCVVSKTI